MKRRGGNALVRNEERILIAALGLHAAGDATTFHGYALSKAMDADGGKSMNYSTVYRCLDRLEERGLLKGAWNTPEGSRRPRREYELTGAGIQTAVALTEAAAYPNSNLGEATT